MKRIICLCLSMLLFLSILPGRTVSAGSKLKVLGTLSIGTNTITLDQDTYALDQAWKLKLPASKTGFYRFYTDIPAVLYLCDQDGTKIFSSHGTYPGEGCSMEYQLTGGVIYYIQVPTIHGPDNQQKVTFNLYLEHSAALPVIKLGNNTLRMSQYRSRYAFTPSVPGVYTFYTTSEDENPDIFLYDEVNNFIGDGENLSPDWWNESIVCELEGKKQYYLEVYRDNGCGDPHKVVTCPLVITCRPSLSKAKVTLSKTHYAYNGKTHKPKPTVIYKGKTLKKGTDYTVSYKNHKKSGVAKVIITGIGKYSGEKIKTFTIGNKLTKATTVVTLKKKSYKFTGSYIKPKPTSVTWNGKKLKKGTHYTLSYENNLGVGTAKVVLKGKGKYYGTVKKSFKIVWLG